MFIIWIVLIGVIIYFFRDKIDLGSNSFKKPDDGEELLKKRYINGEIDEETFLRMRKNLR